MATYSEEDRAMADGLVAFLRAVGVAVVALDSPKLRGITSAQFLDLVESMVDQSPAAERAHRFTGIVRRATEGGQDVRALQEAVDEVYGEGGS